MNFIRRKDSAKDIDSCLLKSSSLQAEETVILNNGTFPKHRGQGNVLSGIGNHSYFLRNRVADIGNIYGGQGNGLSGTGNHSNFLRNTVAGIVPAGFGNSSVD